MRAAVERRRVQVPGPILGPERALELMLDVEQPDPDGSSKKRNWEVHQQGQVAGLRPSPTIRRQQRRGTAIGRGEITHPRQSASLRVRWAPDCWLRRAP